MIRHDKSYCDTNGYRLACESHGVIAPKSKRTLPVIIVASLIISIILAACGEFLMNQYRNAVPISCLVLIAASIFLVFGLLFIISLVGYGITSPFSDDHYKRYRFFEIVVTICFTASLLSVLESFAFHGFVTYYDPWLRSKYLCDLGIDKDEFIMTYNNISADEFRISDPYIEEELTLSNDNVYTGNPSCTDCYHMGNEAFLEIMTDPSSGRIKALRLVGDCIVNQDGNLNQNDGGLLTIQTAFVRLNQTLDKSSDVERSAIIFNNLVANALKQYQTYKNIGGIVIKYNGNGYTYELKQYPVKSGVNNEIKSSCTIQRDGSQAWWNEYKRKTWPLLF